jgi:hypothetical protein
MYRNQNTIDTITGTLAKEKMDLVSKKEKAVNESAACKNLTQRLKAVYSLQTRGLTCVDFMVSCMLWLE